MFEDIMKQPKVVESMANLRESYIELHEAEQNLKKARKQRRLVRTLQGILVVLAVVKVRQVVKQSKDFEKEEK